MSPPGSERENEKYNVINRKAYLGMLHERYARYGDDLLQYLCEVAFKPGGLRRVIARVLKPLPVEEIGMHDALARFLATQGVKGFFELATPGALEKKRKEEEEEHKLQAQQRLEKASRLLRIRISQDELTEMNFPDVGPAPEVIEPLPPEPVAEEWDGTERRGVEDRRTRMERRSGFERRQRMEVVFKNRRFGSDRRSKVNRRSGRDRRSG